MQHNKHPNIVLHKMTRPSLISTEQIGLVGPHFRTKWNTPINVFKKCNKGTLKTLSS